MHGKLRGKKYYAWTVRQKKIPANHRHLSPIAVFKSRAASSEIRHRNEINACLQAAP